MTTYYEKLGKIMPVLFKVEVAVHDNILKYLFVKPLVHLNQLLIPDELTPLS